MEECIAALLPVLPADPSSLTFPAQYLGGRKKTEICKPHMIRECFVPFELGNT